MSPRIIAALLAGLASANAVLNFPNSPWNQQFGKRAHKPARRAAPSSFQYLTNTTQKFAVNGTNIPLYDGDAGESYAGLLPIADEYRVNPNGTDARELFFWFFPSPNPAAADEITIWLTGGPGCSSLVGMLQENGPFLWGPGTEGPAHNPWSWNRLTNIVYVEQPVGVGFTQGTPGLLVDNADVAKEFLGWWKNFVKAFGLQGRKVYITGESYAGYYIPYISDAMLTAADKQFFNLEGVLLVTPIIGDRDSQQQVPHRAMAKEFAHIFPLNATYEPVINALDESCGYTAFLNEYLVYPPKGVQPPAPASTAQDGACDIYFTSLRAVLITNQCLYPYHLTDMCPFPVDAIKNNAGGQYFGRADVQSVINAPKFEPGREWSYCVDPTYANDNTDLSVPPINAVLPRVIEGVKKTMIVTGTLDMALPANGTLLAIQNMTWNGALGFQQAPSGQFFVPYADSAVNDVVGLSGTGGMGVVYEERGLTFVNVLLAGHQLPTYQPAAAFRHLEYLLGRIGSLNGTEEGWTVDV